jgi:hypothetical protein
VAYKKGETYLNSGKRDLVLCGIATYIHHHKFSLKMALKTETCSQQPLIHKTFNKKVVADYTLLHYLINTGRAADHTPPSSAEVTKG